MTKETDNYSKLVNDWKKKFADMENTREKAKLLGLNVRGDTGEIVYFGRRYTFDFNTGEITPEKGGEVPTFDAMFIYHLFCYSENYPTVSGEFVPFRDVKGVAVFEAAFKKLAIDRLTTAFAGKTEKFIAGCQALGGRKLPYGDAGYAIPVFGKMELEIIFWDGDDEFPPSANVLFDKNIVRFTHPETVVQTGIDGACAVIAAAGI